MKKAMLFIQLLYGTFAMAQNDADSTGTFKKRVLEHTEVELLTSYYDQKGDNAAVTGGIGDEKLNDFATVLRLSIPLNDDDVLSIDATVSAYTSASSSNLNPFSGASSGASSGGEDDDDKTADDDGDEHNSGNTGPVTGSPWVASSGASRSDVWFNGTIGYSHSSDNRDNIIDADVSFSKEYDYTSFGVGGGYARQFNDKNTEIGIKANAYIDFWKPVYPTEIIKYIDNGADLNTGYFQDVEILDQNGFAINKSSPSAWHPINNSLVDNKNRNTYSVSLSFSQIMSRWAQFSIFGDVILQRGWLSNPMQRVYFSDRSNYYIGIASNIPEYTSRGNKDVFQLADDIERLPNSRIKFPVGARFNFFLSEHFVIRTYYRYYYDDWDITSHTFNVELPIKLGDKFTLYPSYRYYTQTAARYFAPFEKHLSTEKYYTSDYDLSAFNAHQIGLGFKYGSVFSDSHLKDLNLSFAYYFRNTGFKSFIVSAGVKFIISKRHRKGDDF